MSSHYQYDLAYQEWLKQKPSCPRRHPVYQEWLKKKPILRFPESPLPIRWIEKWIAYLFEALEAYIYDKVGKILTRLFPRS